MWWRWIYLRTNFNRVNFCTPIQRTVTHLHIKAPKLISMHYVFLPKDIQFPQNIFLPTFISFTVNISQKLYLEHNKNEYIAKVVKVFLWRTASWSYSFLHSVLNRPRTGQSLSSSYQSCRHHEHKHSNWSHQETAWKRVCKCF